MQQEVTRGHHRATARIGTVAGAVMGICTLFSTSSAQSGARGVGAPPTPNDAALTVTAVVARALANNPDIVIALLRIDSARAEKAIAAALPNPTVGATPGNPSQYGVQLPLDIGPSRYFRVRASRVGEGAARFDARDAERQVVFAARQTFFDVLLADSLHALAADQADGFRRLLSADSARLRAGSIAERDVVTTRLQLAHADALLARSVVQQHATRLTLALILGSAPDTSLLITGGLAYRAVAIAADSVSALALARRPDLSAATSRVSQSALSLSAARASLLPVPVVGGVYQPAQPFASGSHYAPSVGLTIPILYAFGGERARARAGLAAATLSLSRTRTQVRTEVSMAYDSYLSARELAERYACGLLADASGALEAARYAYDRGATSLPDLLEAIRAYGDTRSDYLTAVHDYWVSIFALERATGANLVSESP